MRLVDRWYILRLIVAAAERVTRATPHPPLNELEERRVDKMAEILERWLSDRVQHPRGELAEFLDAAALNAGSKWFDRIQRIFA